MELPHRNSGTAVWRLVGLWCAFLALFAVLPTDQRAWLLAAGSATASAVTALGIRRRRPHQRRIWVLLAVALGAIAVGDVIQAITHAVTWYSSLFFLLGYLPVGAGLWELGGSDRRPRPFAWVDSTMLLVAVAVLDWQFLLSPRVAQHVAPTGIVSAAVQPGIDLLFLGLLLRLLTGRTQRVTAFWLLIAGSAASLGSDLAVSFTTMAHAYRPGSWPDGLVLLLDAAVSLAATHPSMRDLGNTGPERHGAASRGLVALLAAGAVVPALMIADAGGVLHLSTAVGASASIVLFALAMLRAYLVVRKTELLAAVDELTGLPNRRAFRTRLGELLDDASEAPDVVAGFLDLDEFKAVNDTFGHAVGDALIRAVADRIRDVVGPDDFVARFGGDEFGLLLRGSAFSSTASITANRLVACLSLPFLVDGLSLRIGASLGLVRGFVGADAERIMSDADVAMYTAKRRGGGRAVEFAVEMRDELLGPSRLMTDLEAALLAEDGGGLWVAFQPVVSLATGALDGCEALIRWDHPTRGPLAPDSFIPLAEEHGLVALLDAFVLRRALAQLRAWQDEDRQLRQLRVSVNVSADTLGRSDLASSILWELAAAGIRPERLFLEITEHTQLAHDTAADENLTALVAAGVMVALDDFGTGYSSALYFERFPIHSVKLDRSIIATLSGGRVSAVARGFGALASSLGLLVLAEGVETEDQLAPLHELGFTLAQGWYFARPGRPDDVVRYAREHGLTSVEFPTRRLLEAVPA